MCNGPAQTMIHKIKLLQKYGTESKTKQKSRNIITEMVLIDQVTAFFILIDLQIFHTHCFEFRLLFLY